MEDFRLLETLLYQPDSGFFLLEEHLARMAASSRYFGFRFPVERIQDQLVEAVGARGPSDGGQALRVRLLLDRNGELEITAVPLAPISSGSKEHEARGGDVPLPSVALSRVRTNSRDPFLRHKTTRRELYDQEFQLWTSTADCTEVLFLNERDEVTEGSRTNIFIEKDGVWLTPPASSGLLEGTLRNHLLKTRGAQAREAVLRLEDLRSADRLFIVNSLRGAVEARLSES